MTSEPVSENERFAGLVRNVSKADVERVERYVSSGPEAVQAKGAIPEDQLVGVANHCSPQFQS